MEKKQNYPGRLLSLALLLTLLAGCSQAGSATPITSPDPADKGQPPPESSLPQGAKPTLIPGSPLEEVTLPVPGSLEAERTIDPAMEPLIAMAKADLAERLGVDETEIEVLEARAVVWPDASLGCPEPGMAYIQILFDGGLIVLQVGDQEYNYHSGGSDGPFLCEQGGK